MSQAPDRPLPAFEVGDRAWFADGRTGLVTIREFNPVADQWQYFLEGLGGMFLESDLLAEDPDPPPEFDFEPPPVTLPPPPVTIAPVPQLTPEFVNEAIQAAESRAADRLDAHLLDMHGALDIRFSDLAASNTLFRDNVATELSEIRDTLASLEAEAEQGSGFGLFGFFGAVGGFLRNPLDWLLERVGQQVRDEINDGLTR